MKRLAVVLGVLVALAGISAAVGILMARSGSGLGGPVVLVWRVSGPLPERAPAPLLPLPGYEEPASIATLHRAFAAARTDPRVRGIAVSIEDTWFGLAKAQELRRQLESLRAAGKFARCFLETAGEGYNGTLAYYLASACDRIELAPTGELNLLGLYANSTFVRGTLDKLKIEPVFLQVGAYKSATETFTETERSPAAEEAVGALLDSNYQQLVGDLARARKLEPAALRAIIDRAPHGAARSLELKLVDAVGYADAFRDGIEELVGAEPAFVPILDYRPRRLRSGRTVAIFSAEGTILRGAGGVEPWSDEVFLGSRDLARELGALREDDGIAAVVLRIDSPGGSALASDLMLHEVERLRAVKPVVVSMSDVAASGGYYIAARANKIVAEPSTITGSIGVFAGKLATRRFQQELLGISHDAALRGARADLYSSLDPFTADQSAVFAERMRSTYDTFVGHVAAGRGLEPAAVEKVAAGRVWTGADALRVGLVDELGGLDRALELAAEAAGIEAGTPYRVAYFPKPPGLLDALRGRSQPDLPVEVAELLSALRQRPLMALELPPQLRGLARPF